MKTPSISTGLLIFGIIIISDELNVVKVQFITFVIKVIFYFQIYHAETSADGC